MSASHIAAYSASRCAREKNKAEHSEEKMTGFHFCLSLLYESNALKEQSKGVAMIVDSEGIELGMNDLPSLLSRDVKTGHE
eukprot:IDg10573t1